MKHPWRKLKISLRSKMENLEGKYHLGALGVDGRIILK
jgi:hypothetical protein